MSDKQKGNRNHGGDRLREKSNGGFEKKNANRHEDQKKQQTPNEEVPNVGDHAKKGAIVSPTHKSSKEHANQKNEKEEGLGENVSKGKVRSEEENAQYGRNNSYPNQRRL